MDHRNRQRVLVRLKRRQSRFGGRSRICVVTAERKQPENTVLKIASYRNRFRNVKDWGTMPLTDAEKAANKRSRMIETAKKYGASGYLRKYVAPDFQRMIRAEYGAVERPEPCVMSMEYTRVHSPVGMCVCVTCGKSLPWSSSTWEGEGMDTGHFLASRRASILLIEENVAPQCQGCNKHLHGAPEAYRVYMVNRYGQEKIDWIHHLKSNVSTQFTIPQLVDLRNGYKERLRIAEVAIGCSK